MKRLNDRKLRRHAHRIAATHRRLNRRYGAAQCGYPIALRVFRSLLGY